MKKHRLHIVIGFRGALLRDTLATTARQAKRLCINSLWRDHSEYEQKVQWRDVESWGWRCVPATLSYSSPKKPERRSRQ